jgi:hypothetical protein
MDGTRPLHGWSRKRRTFGWVLGLFVLSSPTALGFFPPVIQPPGPPVTPPPVNPPPVVVPPVDPPPVVVPPRQVPEPATLLTALAGLATAAGYHSLRKRRKHSKGVASSPPLAKTGDSSQSLP